MKNQAAQRSLFVLLLRTGEYLCFSKASMSSPVWCIERQNNVFFGYTYLHELISNTYFGSVFLNPDLIIFYVDMDYAVVRALQLFPANTEQLEMEVFSINNDLILIFHPVANGTKSFVLLQDMYNLFRVGIYFTHRSMLFVLTLITKIFRPSSEIASFTISWS